MRKRRAAEDDADAERQIEKLRRKSRSQDRNLQDIADDRSQERQRWEDTNAHTQTHTRTHTHTHALKHASHASRTLLSPTHQLAPRRVSVAVSRSLGCGEPDVGEGVEQSRGGVLDVEPRGAHVAGHGSSEREVVEADVRRGERLVGLRVVGRGVDKHVHANAVSMQG